MFENPLVAARTRSKPPGVTKPGKKNSGTLSQQLATNLRARGPPQAGTNAVPANPGASPLAQSRPYFVTEPPSPRPRQPPPGPGPIQPGEFTIPRPAQAAPSVAHLPPPQEQLMLESPIQYQDTGSRAEAQLVLAPQQALGSSDTEQDRSKVARQRPDQTAPEAGREQRLLRSNVRHGID